MKIAPLLRTLVFVALNFAALGIGAFLMNEGPASDWYLNLNKAPWTPPGFVFGLAWTTIMLLFGVFMGLNYSRQILPAYVLHIVSNVMWNPTFFHFHLPLTALLIFPLLLLTLIKINSINTKHTLLLLPYYAWVAVAISLNLYIVLYN